MGLGWGWEGVMLREQNGEVLLERKKERFRKHGDTGNNSRKTNIIYKFYYSVVNIKQYILIANALESTENHKKMTIKITTLRNNHISEYYWLRTIAAGSDQSGGNLGRTKTERWEGQMWSCTNNCNKRKYKVHPRDHGGLQCEGGSEPWGAIEV